MNKATGTLSMVNNQYITNKKYAKDKSKNMN